MRPAAVHVVINRTRNAGEHAIRPEIEELAVGCLFDAVVVYLDR